MEIMKFEKLREYKRNYISTRITKAKEMSEEIDFDNNFDEGDEKLLIELRKVLKEIDGFR